jgi:hypothetical protein
MKVIRSWNTRLSNWTGDFSAKILYVFIVSHILSAVNTS